MTPETLRTVNDLPGRIAPTRIAEVRPRVAGIVVERVFKQGDRTVREEYRKDGSHAELTVLLPNGVIVEAKGEQVGIEQLRSVVGSVDLNKLATTARQPG